MIAAIESTSKTTEVNGLPGRIWHGVTQEGVHFNCFISLIEVEEGYSTEEFDREFNAFLHHSPALHELLKQ